MGVKSCLVFGGFGTIGKAVVDHFDSKGYSVWATSRDLEGRSEKVIKVVGLQEIDPSELAKLPPLDAVVWVFQKAHPLHLTRVVEVDEDTHSLPAARSKDGSQEAGQAECRKNAVGEIGWL